MYGTNQFTFEYTTKIAQGIPFRKAVISSDEMFLIVCTVDKKNNKDCIGVYDAGNGEFISKMACFIKNVQFMVPMPRKSHLVAMISLDKTCIIDIKAKQKLKTLDKWNGNITSDGKYGLYAPTRGGFELIDVRKGTSVRTFIPRVAEGIVTVLSLFTDNDQYVCYYHTSRKTIRVFRIGDASMIANYRLPAELTSIKSTKDGRSIVLGTVDGCLSVLTIADPAIEDVSDYLLDLPSRDENWKIKMAQAKAKTEFKAAIRVVNLATSLKCGSEDKNKEDKEE